MPTALEALLVLSWEFCYRPVLTRVDMTLVTET